MPFAMPFKLFKPFIGVLFAMFVAACNPMAQLDTAEDEIAQFHTIYNSGDSRALYGLTAQEFRDNTSPAQMTELVSLVTERMGKAGGSERTGFNVNSNDGDTYTVVTMTTSFEKGDAVETFTFTGTGDDMALVGWNVDSPNFQDVPEEAVTQVEAVQ